MRETNHRSLPVDCQGRAQSSLRRSTHQSPATLFYAYGYVLQSLTVSLIGMSEAPSTYHSVQILETIDECRCVRELLAEGVRDVVSGIS